MKGHAKDNCYKLVGYPSGTSNSLWFCTKFNNEKKKIIFESGNPAYYNAHHVQAKNDNQNIASDYYMNNGVLKYQDNRKYQVISNVIGLYKQMYLQAPTQSSSVSQQFGACVH